MNKKLFIFALTLNIKRYGIQRIFRAKKENIY
jgi:hypothetical protein